MVFPEESPTHPAGSVECPGMTFWREGGRRAVFLEKLREKLGDPEFRRSEGFPLGSDEDILALSDPPWYTACPNPFLEEFITCYGRAPDAGRACRRAPHAGDHHSSTRHPVYAFHP